MPSLTPYELFPIFFWQMTGPIKIHNRGELWIFEVFRTDLASMEYVSGTGDVSKGLCLSKLKKPCCYWNQEIINNLRAESIWQNFIKNTSKFEKNGTVSRKLWMIVSNGQMLTGYNFHSGRLITYFCKEKCWRFYDLHFFTCSSCLYHSSMFLINVLKHYLTF